MIKVGDRLPEADLLELKDGVPSVVPLGPVLRDRKVVIFGLPGAYTPTCSAAHLPSFMRVMDGLKEKGVDEVICLSVNDPWVMDAWGKASGGSAAGIRFLADASCSFTEAIGMRFDAPARGFVARSLRYALAAEDGVVTRLHMEEKGGVCDLTGGEAMLAAL
jgi:peroxiredoxin